MTRPYRHFDPAIDPTRGCPQIANDRSVALPIAPGPVSMPTTRGACGGSTPAAEIIRNSVSQLIGLSDRREPDSPPTASRSPSGHLENRQSRTHFDSPGDLLGGVGCDDRLGSGILTSAMSG